jgi:hypothetical protein
MLCFALTCLQCEAVIGRWNWPPIFAETHMHLRIRGDVLPFHVIVDVIAFPPSLFGIRTSFRSLQEHSNPSLRPSCPA